VQTCTPFPWHCVWFGAQTPLQAPPTQVLFTHVVVAPQVPAAVHVWTPLPVLAHCAAPGEQTAQAPFTQAGVVPVHGVWFCH